MGDLRTLADGVVSASQNGRPYTLTRQGDGCLVSFQGEDGQFVSAQVEATDRDEFERLVGQHDLSLPPPDQFDRLITGDEEAGESRSTDELHETDALMLTCFKCESRFESQEELDRHIKAAHTWPVLCTICGAKFGDIRDVMRHRREVHGRDAGAPDK